MGSTNFASGQYDFVVEPRFSDSEYWIARIRFPTDPTYGTDVEASILNEITTMDLVSSRTSIPISKVYGFDISTINPLDFRYIDRRSPCHTSNKSFSKTEPRRRQDKVAEQLVDYYFQFGNLRFDDNRKPLT